MNGLKKKKCIHLQEQNYYEVKIAAAAAEYLLYILNSSHYWIRKSYYILKILLFQRLFIFFIPDNRKKIDLSMNQ